MKIKDREKTAILNSLRTGVVPRVGLQHIQVGRKNELEAILGDLGSVKEEGSTIRLIVGEFGSGKTFFLTLSSSVAQSEGFVTSRVDITTERTLYARDGKARSTYTELVSNFSTKTKPDGNALSQIIDKWISDNQIDFNDSNSSSIVEEKLRPLSEFVSGMDFAKVISSYIEGYRDDNRSLMDNSLRWLKGEYPNKTSAKSDLPVMSIITDENYYDYLKLWSAFIGMTSFKGMLICIDELAVLARLKSNVRAKNYEAILKMINDSLQGANRGIMFLLGGTPEFVYDKNKGLYSYGALETRLAKNPFETEGIIDFSNPTINLPNLTPEELFVCFKNIRNVFSKGDENIHLINDEGLHSFLNHCYKKMGAESFLSPREAIKDFVGLLSILEQNPNKTWEDFIDSLKENQGYESELENFKLG